ncbi:hypothetical protein Bbelb_250400 [Branchiostoma belcheri]|nr:hypothetical protein Bbelb_250400 [Branchiostoma belcheri]
MRFADWIILSDLAQSSICDRAFDRADKVKFENGTCSVEDGAAGRKKPAARQDLPFSHPGPRESTRLLQHNDLYGHFALVSLTNGKSQTPYMGISVSSTLPIFGITAVVPMLVSADPGNVPARLGAEDAGPKSSKTREGGSIRREPVLHHDCKPRRQVGKTDSHNLSSRSEEICWHLEITPKVTIPGRNVISLAVGRTGMDWEIKLRLYQASETDGKSRNWPNRQVHVIALRVTINGHPSVWPGQLTASGAAFFLGESHLLVKKERAKNKLKATKHRT